MMPPSPAHFNGHNGGYGSVADVRFGPLADITAQLKLGDGSERLDVESEKFSAKIERFAIDAPPLATAVQR